MSDEIRTKFAKKLQDEVARRAKGVWADLSEHVKGEVLEALEDIAELTLLTLRDQDEAEQLVTSRELLHAKARLANWKFVGSDVVRQAIKDALKDAAELVGAFLKGIIR